MLVKNYPRRIDYCSAEDPFTRKTVSSAVKNSMPAMFQMFCMPIRIDKCEEHDAIKAGMRYIYEYPQV